MAHRPAPSTRFPCPCCRASVRGDVWYDCRCFQGSKKTCPNCRRPKAEKGSDRTSGGTPRDFDSHGPASSLFRFGMTAPSQALPPTGDVLSQVDQDCVANAGAERHGAELPSPTWRCSLS